ncbi:hypothetical protein FIBSPDRAFT_892471 [Athelia psychrophila]|uniref:Uncharacterized protein n=1 Tax=Athelia psychrophila TaxID=1759441 RepID=A0A166IDC7_9AGAM|nr:hypothetical protein FIBSPDRAFT_892471 [Fibularhizoctonia sp. CBS 109695]
MSCRGPSESLADLSLTVEWPAYSLLWASGTGRIREHRDLEKLLVPCIAGVVPPDVLSAIRAIDEFTFQSQGVLIYNEGVHAIGQALHKFHHYKNSIIKARGRVGKNGPILHFNIPKLECMAMIIRSICEMGGPFQYTSDITERCHLTLVKTPYQQSNKVNHHPQMVRWMDQDEMMRVFGLYTTLEGNNISLVNTVVQEASEATDPYPEVAWLAQVLSPDEFRMAASGSSRPSSLFSKTKRYNSNDRSIVSITMNFLILSRPYQPLKPNLEVRECLRPSSR